MPLIQNVPPKAVASVAYPISRRNDNIERSTEKVMPEVEGLVDTTWFLIKMIFGIDERGRRIENTCLAIILEVEAPREDTVQTVHHPRGIIDGGGVGVGIIKEKSTMNVVEDHDVWCKALVHYSKYY